MNTKWVIFLVIAASAFGLHTLDKHYAVKQAVTETQIKMNEEYQKKVDKLVKLNIETVSEMQAASAVEIEKKDEKLKTTNNRLSIALGELRNRPLRPDPASTNVPEPSGSTKTCTGAQLYREDAELLTRESARAEALIIERDYYYNEYENARRKIERFNNGNKP